jgi:hypothetical protein
MIKEDKDFPIYIKDKIMAKKLCNIYNIIDEYNLWDDIAKDESNPLIYTRKDWLKILFSNKIIINDGHSGCSMMCCINDMKFINSYGWDKYCENNI